MKTKITLLLSFAALSLTAQIPNADFENWTAGDPDGWQTSNSNSASVINIFQSTNAHTNASAARLETWTYQSFWFGATMVCPNTGNFFPVNSGQPASLTGWYVSNFVGGDKLTINTVLQQGGSSVAGGTINITNNSSVYQQFTIPFTYSPSTAVPDSGAIAMTEYTSTNQAVGLHSGTYIILDDLAFGGPNSVKEYSTEGAIEKIYPNPSNEISWIEYSLDATKPVSITVYDMNGNAVKTIVDQEQSAGRYRAAIETSTMTGGIYLVRMQCGNETSAMRFVVTD